MKVKAIKHFYDRQGLCLRYPGSEFEASEVRIEAINGTAAGQLVEIIPEQEPDKAAESTAEGAAQAEQPAEDPKTKTKPKAAKPK